jgi:hypothetical protein
LELNKIFDLFFTPKVFFKNSTFGPFDSLLSTLILWLVNIIVIFPVFKETPLFGGFFYLSLVILALIFLYEIFSGALHMFVARNEKVFWGFPYVLIPHILTGWILSVALFWNLSYIFLAIPIVWSVLLEFYLVRSSMGRGILYTLMMRVSRDIVFFLVIAFIFRRWFL